MKFCRNFADNVILENVEHFRNFEFFQFNFLAKVPEFWTSEVRKEKEKMRKCYFETSLTELCCEKLVWFDPSPIEPFNLGRVALRPFRLRRLGGAVSVRSRVGVAPPVLGAGPRRSGAGFSLPVIPVGSLIGWLHSGCFSGAGG